MNVHGTDVRQRALALVAQGRNLNADVARQTGIPLGTIGYWKHAGPR